MAVNLTDEQRQKLQQIEERHRRWRHHRFHEAPAESASPTPVCAGDPACVCSIKGAAISLPA